MGAPSRCLGRGEAVGPARDRRAGNDRRHDPLRHLPDRYLGDLGHVLSIDDRGRVGAGVGHIDVLAVR